MRKEADFYIVYHFKQHLVRGIIQIQDGSSFVQLLLSESKGIQILSQLGTFATHAGVAPA